jgi:hypothetical protein
MCLRFHDFKFKLYIMNLPAVGILIGFAPRVRRVRLEVFILAGAFGSIAVAQTAAPAAGPAPSAPEAGASAETVITLAHAPAVSAPAPGASAPVPSAVVPAAGVPASKPGTPAPPLPPKLDPSVPDNVNPFADKNNLPTPLPPPLSVPKILAVDTHPTMFDGLPVMQMTLSGPNFAWVTQPMDDWITAPTGAGESLAYVYEFNPKVRASLALYGPQELLPDMNAAALVQYLAAIRAAVDPENFSLLTPVPPNTMYLNPTGYFSFPAQSVDYETIFGTELTMHHDIFVNLHDEYQLQICLTGPPTLVRKLEAQVNLFLVRGNVLNGLGVQAAAKPGQ